MKRATAKKAAPRAKRSRTRSGCYTCRDRHMKCDEQLPVCQNCINSKRKCYRGIRLNFTSYMYYDPKSSGCWDKSLSPTQHRILDQSIAVSKLFKNGYNTYKQYKSLHTPTELAEAELVLQKELTLNSNSANHHLENIAPVAGQPLLLPSDDFNQFFDSWLYSSHGADQYRNQIQENVDIKRILMNPELHNKQLHGAIRATFTQKLDISPTPPPSAQTNTAPDLRNILEPEGFTPRADPHVEFQTSPEDADAFIRVLHVQKYFWLLDLFNELRIWESCIPSYCIRTYQASHADTFLLDCLLSCDVAQPIERILASCGAQQQKWHEFENRDVTFATYKAFEKVLISVVLLVHAVLIRTTQNGFVLTANFAMILANQGKLVHKLLARFQRIPTSLLKRLGSTVFTIGAFQAINIVRFFLKMRLRKLNIAFPDLGADTTAYNPGAATISYDPREQHNFLDFFVLAEYEVLNLCQDYKGFDFTAGRFPSKAALLRSRLWELILQQYQVKPVPHDFANVSESDPSSSDAPSLDSDGMAPYFSNSKVMAASIIESYYTKIWGAERRKGSMQRLSQVFDQIEKSALPYDIKAKWVYFFDWAITD